MHMTATPRPRFGLATRLLTLALTWLPLAVLAALVAAHLVFFALRTDHLLRYPFALDYGEGPLLAQVAELGKGTPIWALYGDPAQPPYLVVNYPPVYLLATWAASRVAPVLLAGRLVSLVATLAATIAIGMLAAWPRSTHTQRWHGLISAWLVALVFAGIPIVREWAAVMRVDMLGLALGLWALVVVQRRAGTWGVLWAAPLLALSLLTKPSLLAAPIAAGLWLLFRDSRRAIGLGLLTGALAGIVTLGLQLASGGWFALHVVTANANTWDARLAFQFWRDQMVIMQPLMLAGMLVAGWNVLYGRIAARQPKQPAFRIPTTLCLLPVYYTLAGLATAFGVGKLGAYTNYFLEAYAGLVWLAATGLRALPMTGREHTAAPIGGLVRAGATALFVALAGATLLRYYPVWSEEYLLPAGVVEGRNPARVSFGGHGVWQDLQREQVVLAARAQINAALAGEVQAAAGPLFTDIPGLAAQNGVQARLQVFEHRMLYDVGAWDQRPLLRDLANGRQAVIILDYLGNWLTPQMINLITSRYAQDVSVGTYSVYRPIRLPEQTPATGQRFGPIELVSHGMSASSGADGPYAPGQLLIVTATWRAGEGISGQPDVVLQLATPDGQALFESSEPLLYGALPPSDWGGQAMQHLQAFTIPHEFPPGTYQFMLGLRQNGADLGAPVTLEDTFQVQENGGQVIGEQGYFVPRAMLAAWNTYGGNQGAGEALMPAIDFGQYVEQCFQRACLRLNGDQAVRVPIGELAWLADAGLPRAPAATFEQDRALVAAWNALGGQAALGAPVGHPIMRFGYITQYTQYARLERWYEGGPVQLGNLGQDVFRLPGDTPYRWPPVRAQ